VNGNAGIYAARRGIRGRIELSSRMGGDPVRPPSRPVGADDPVRPPDRRFPVINKSDGIKPFGIRALKHNAARNGWIASRVY